MRRLLVMACAFWLALAGAAQALTMKISNISDFSLGVWSMGDPALESSMNICIHGINITALTSYAITVSSSPSGYRLTNGTNTIVYSLYWKDNISGALGTQLSDGVKLTGQTGPNLLPDCTIGGPNARLTIRISQAAMEAALSGTYNGTITLLLTPT